MMSMRRLFRTSCLRASTCLLLAPSIVCFTHSARAQGTPPQSSQEAQYRRASEAVAAKDWAEAHRLLLDLWSKSHSYDVASSLGQVEMQLGHAAAAAQYFDFALENMSPREKPEVVTRVQQTLADLRRQIGTVELTLEPSNAELIVDGEAVAFTPTPSEIFLTPGNHTFAARLGDRTSAREGLEVVAGTQYRLDLKVDLGGGEARTSATTSTAPTGTPPAAAPQLPPPSSPPGRDSGKRSFVPVWIGVAVTAAGVATWTGFTVDAKSAKDDASRYRDLLGPNGCSSGTANPADCSAARAAFDRQRRDVSLADVGLGVAVVAGAATLGYVLFWPSSSKTQNASSVALAPAVGPQGGGLLVRARF